MDVGPDEWPTGTALTVLPVDPVNSSLPPASEALLLSAPEHFARMKHVHFIQTLNSLVLFPFASYSPSFLSLLCSAGNSSPSLLCPLSSSSGS